MSNIVKSNFIQFSEENFKVIDTNSLVAKRLEGFSGVLRENLDDDDNTGFINGGGEENIDPLAMAELLADRDSGAAVNEAAISGEGEIENEGFEHNVEAPGETAEDILHMKEEALKEIDAIRENARNEIEELRTRAREEGYEAGYSEGSKKALDEYRARDAELNARAAQLEDEYKKLALNLEPRIVETIVRIYKGVFGDSLYSRKDVIQTLVTAALFNASGDEDIIIRVSPDDYEGINNVKEDLKNDSGLKSELSVVSDDRLDPGNVKVETLFGIMDCSIDTELEELSKTLRVLSYGGTG